jgi:hypothetical protein
MEFWRTEKGRVFMSKNKTWKSTLVVMAGLVLAVSISARADFIMHSATATTGNQAYSGVGLTFDVVAPSGIEVLGLGIYDSGRDGIVGAGTTLSTVLFDSTHAVLQQIDFTTADSGVLDVASNYRFKDLSSPLVLSPGRYTIVGYGWTTSDNYEHNTYNGGTGPVFNNGGGSISFYQSAWTTTGNAPAPTFPTLTGSPDYFDGPNMRFAVVPVPAAVLLGLLGLGAAGLKLRRFA